MGSRTDRAASNLLRQGARLTLWLTRPVSEALVSEGLAFAPLETGGLLLGWRDGANKVVAGIVGAGHRALHGRFTFLPDHAWQVERLREAHEKSARDLDYLGDWHTHPDGPPAMSGLDRRTLSRIARKVRSPVMLICSHPGPDPILSAWSSERPRLLRSESITSINVKIVDPPTHWPSYFAF